MRNEYRPARHISGNVANGMNRPGNGKRFGTVADAFSHSSAYWGERQSWYVVAAVNRDSDCLERANWHALVKLLGGEGEQVTIEEASHWA